MTRTPVRDGDPGRSGNWALYGWLAVVLAVGLPREMYQRARTRLGRALVGAGVCLIDAGDRLLPTGPPPSDGFCDRLAARLGCEFGKGAQRERSGAT